MKSIETHRVMSTVQYLQCRVLLLQDFGTDQ